jgi:hypothetical protein
MAIKLKKKFGESNEVRSLHELPVHQLWLPIGSYNNTNRTATTYTVRRDFGISDVDHRHHNCLALSFFAFLCSLALTLLSRRSANSGGKKTMSAVLSSPRAGACVAREV